MDANTLNSIASTGKWDNITTEQEFAAQLQGIYGLITQKKSIAAECQYVWVAPNLNTPIKADALLGVPDTVDQLGQLIDEGRYDRILGTTAMIDGTRVPVTRDLLRQQPDFTLDWLTGGVYREFAVWAHDDFTDRRLEYRNQLRKDRTLIHHKIPVAFQGLFLRGEIHDWGMLEMQLRERLHLRPEVKSIVDFHREVKKIALDKKMCMTDKVLALRDQVSPWLLNTGNRPVTIGTFTRNQDTFTGKEMQNPTLTLICLVLAGWDIDANTWREAEGIALKASGGPVITPEIWATNRYEGFQHIDETMRRRGGKTTPSVNMAHTAGHDCPCCKVPRCNDFFRWKFLKTLDFRKR